MSEKLTTAQAAKYLDLTPSRVRQLAREGLLKFTSTPLGRLFSRSALDFYKRHRTPVGRPPKK